MNAPAHLPLPPSLYADTAFAPTPTPPLDAHKKADRPTVAAIVERIGPMRNKVATENTAETSEARRERRRSRA